VIGPPVYIGEARSHDELIQVMAERKSALGLSNEFLDNTIPLSDGHTDKVLGPSRERGLSQFTLDGMLAALALKLVLVEDPEQAARMRPRWEGRDQRQVRPPARIGKSLIARARPHVVRELGRQGGKARWRGVDPEVRRRLMTQISWARPSVRKAIEAARSGDCAAAETTP
jgi:hypothetical protein